MPKSGLLYWFGLTGVHPPGRVDLELRSNSLCDWDMPFTDLENLLLARFDARRAAGFDGTIRLAVDSDALEFTIRDGQLVFGDGATPDVTFTFSDVETAKALLSGQGNAIDAFMQGRFKADGYLMWAFALMGFFQNASRPVDATD